MAVFRTHAAVLLAVPQLIGYLRAVLYILGFAACELQTVGGMMPGYVACLVCYTIAFVLDVFDGMVARKLDQCSILGNVLDMVLDRSATAALLSVLAGAYPRARLYFAFLVALDVSSHWMHTASCQLKPVRGHHKAKETLEKRNWLLRMYYGIYPLFGYCCVGTEVFYIALLGLSYVPEKELLSNLTWFICFPACLLKNIVNVMQLFSAMVAIADLDLAESKDS